MQKKRKKPARYKCMFVVIEISTLVNDFIAKKSACCNRVTEFGSGTKWSPMLKCSLTTSTRLRKAVCFASVYS